ncbi:MAG TPA: TIGR00366 family protein [Gemmatimonadales bacterium]|nr:TIGR00366 family protein [Gemmatimonadales bacterium]
MSEPRPGALERVALRFTDLAERWLPDAFVFALVATIVVVVAGATAGGASLPDLAAIWGRGFWSLIPFTLQMALIVITGTVVATAAPVRRAIDRLAGLPRGNRSAVVFVAVISMVTSWLNWGFGLVFTAVLARAVARRVPGVDYRTLAACVLLGLGSVWAQGLSGSAALQMATPGMLPAGIREIVASGGGAGAAEVADGIIPLADTIFLWQSLLSVAIEIVIVAALIAVIVPTGPRIRTARDLGVELDDPPAPADDQPRTPGEWLEHRWWLNAVVVALAGTALVLAVRDAPSLTGAITLDRLNLLFLALGFALHRTPARLMRAFRDAVPSTWGILLQFPFYAGIAAIITDTHLNAAIADVFTSAATRLTFPPLIAAYSAVLGVFVPSGGSKWVLEAPYVMQAAHNLGVHLGWMVAVYDLGEALANLVQPFWMLPVLAMLGLRARDIMGITFTVFLVLLPVVLVLVTVLGATLPYPL